MELADEEIKRRFGMPRVGALNDGGHFFDSFNGNAHIEIRNQKLTYYLVPVWFMNVKYKRKEYTLAMNGQTGKLASPDVPFHYKGKLVYGLIFTFFELLAFVLWYSFFKIDDTFSDALVFAIIFTMICTFLPYMATECIWSKISYKYIGESKSTQKHYYNIQNHNVDKEEISKRKNKK